MIFFLKKVTILSGTKSDAGNSNTVAQLLVDRATEFNFNIGESPMAIDDYLPTMGSNNPFCIIALCLSTYQGNPAPNAKKSYDWLKGLVTRLENGEQELSTYLSNVHYFVFGCGNMNWATTYQKVAIYFDENLKKLGAKRLCKIGLYDESQDDLEECFADFYKSMAPKLMHSIPEIGEKRLRAVDASVLGGAPAVKAQAASSAHVMELVGDAEEIGTPELIPTSISGKKIFRCPVKKIVDITPNADRSTVHVEFEMQEGKDQNVYS